MLFMLSTMAVLVAQRSSSPSTSGSDSAAAGGIGLMGVLCMLVVIIGIQAVCFWKVFEKAGHPGWASLVPIYNTVIFLQMGGQNPLWVLVALIPFCGGFIFLYPAIMASIEIAKRFGKDPIYAVGLIFVPFVFFPMLGFGSAQYRAPGLAMGRA
jgi:hypothetical protein